MKLVGDFWFPAEDRHCGEASQRECVDLEFALKYVKKTEICVQAGGNCGVWASYLAKTFAEVWTFEPDFENYMCLLRNIPENVFPFLAGVGHKRSTVGLDRFPKNCGAHQTTLSGDIALMTIDELKLKACDLIQLDIEGFEPLAIEGARQTIEQYTPVLMLEDKDLSRRYGHRHGWIEREITGYRVAEKVHNDLILVPV